MNMKSQKRGGDSRRDSRLLRRLARSCGISTCFENWGGAVVHSPPVTLVRLVNVLTGAQLADQPSVPELQTVLNDITRERRKPGALPMIVSWGGRLKQVWLWLPRRPKKIHAMLALENGQYIELPATLSDVTRRGGMFRARLSWKALRLPEGYHRLEVVADGNCIGTSLIVSAPTRMKEQDKGWGLFVPTYALQTANASGIGGFRELKEAAEEVKKAGGDFIGTLPLLAIAYEGDSPDPSPYAPQSRLFWNEIFLDTGAAGERQKGGLVDYGFAYAQKRAAIAEDARHFFQTGGDRTPEYEAFLKASPYLHDYARFRAQREGGGLEAEHFHQYAQYQCHRQLSDFRSADRYAELYLDYPIGVRTGGFDATHFSQLFLPGVQVGAPPDMFFSKGQNWGFQPFHPARLVEDEFRHFRATLDNYFRYARMLRLDHIMGLYRLYCIPEGFSAEHGAYIHYPFDLFLGVLCLEAKRRDGLLAGEDLGTVPGPVRKAMTRHGISRMWVAQLEMKPSPRKTFRAVKPNMIASLNTHDLFPFAAYVDGKDIDELARLGVMSPDEALSHRQHRKRSLKEWRGGEQALQAALKHLAASPARRVIVNIEDLWRETLPQNIPGTFAEYANWRRRLPYAANEWRRQKGLRAALKTLNQYRGRHGQR